MSTLKKSHHVLLKFDKILEWGDSQICGVQISFTNFEAFNPPFCLEHWTYAIF